MNKNNKIIMMALIIIAALLLGFLTTKKAVTGKLSKPVGETVISKDITGYKLDLRIYGTYEKKSINEIVMVTNFKNTDKEIHLIRMNGKDSIEKDYVVKENKYYEVEKDNLKKVKSVPYENTDIYLDGVKNMTSVKEKGREKLGKNEYTVYTGKVSKKVMNKMLDATDTKIKVTTDAETEVWLNKDNQVYKVYYKADDITIYPSYFGFNKYGEVDLSNYKG